MCMCNFSLFAKCFWQECDDCWLQSVFKELKVILEEFMEAVTEATFLQKYSEERSEASKAFL